jgi:restriction system protein
MARSYSDHSLGDDAVFPVVVLLACVVWTHKVVVLKVEHYLRLACVVGAVIIGLVIIYNLVKRFKTWAWKRNPDMTVVDNMTGIEFEHYVARLLEAQGYKNIRLTEEYDFGIDIIAFKDGTTWGIQVKRYSNMVKAAAIRQAVTALKYYKCDKAMVVTNSTFSNTAKRLADSNGCMLINRDGLQNWTV